MVNTRSTLSGEISEVPDKGIRARFVLGSMASIRAGSLSSIIHQMEDLSCLTRSLIEDVKQIHANRARDHQELKSLILGLYPRSADPVAISSIDTTGPSLSNEEDKEIKSEIEDLEALISDDLNCSKQSQISVSFPSLNHQLTALHMLSCGNRSSNLDDNIVEKEEIVEKEIIDDESKMEGGGMIEGKIVQILVDCSKFEDVKEASEVFDKIPHKDLFFVSACKVFDEISHKNLFTCSEYLDSDLLATYELIARYERANHSCDARRIFELIPKRVIVLFNSVFWNNPCLNWVEFPFDPGGNSISV